MKLSLASTIFFIIACITTYLAVQSSGTVNPHNLLDIAYFIVMSSTSVGLYLMAGVHLFGDNS